MENTGRVFFLRYNQERKKYNQDSPLIPDWRAPSLDEWVEVSVVSSALDYFARSVLILLKVTFVVSFMSRWARSGDHFPPPGSLDLSIQSQNISVSVATCDFSENENSFGSISLEGYKSVRLCLAFASCINKVNIRVLSIKLKTYKT